MTEKYIETERGTVYYWISDNISTEKRTIVFLHGLTANHHLFDKQVSEFEKNYNVMAWDAPAHGKSRPYKNFSYAFLAEDLKTILDTENIKKAVLVGQSAGGFVSQSFVKAYPDMVEGIMLIGSSPYNPVFFSKSDLFWLKQTKWMFNMYSYKSLINTMAKNCSSTENAFKNMLSMLEIYKKKELCRLLYIGFAGFIPEMCDIKIKCPVWLVVGENDKTGKVRYYNEEWHARNDYPLHIIKDASHNANDDQPEKVNELINEFIAQLDIISEESENDNTTPLSARDYDNKINNTIPYLTEFHKQTISVVENMNFEKIHWLDLGCGTGMLVKRAEQLLKNASFVMLDPSEDMIASAKFNNTDIIADYVVSTSEKITYQNEFNVVTAIQSHHYLHENERKKAVQNVYNALCNGGVYIMFENVVPEDEAIKQAELQRWGEYQKMNGKTDDEVREHIARCGVKYFPITVHQHINLLKECGFTKVHLFWYSYMQAGIYAIKD